jgi:hypothetical protein
MKRLYYHAGWVMEGANFYCPLCGKQFSPTTPYWEALFSEEPCLETSVLYEEDADIRWAISVWNCHATLVAYDSRGLPLEVEIAPEVAEEVEDIILAAVESQGALNISGAYSPPDELIPYLLRGEVRAKRRGGR